MDETNISNPSPFSPKPPFTKAEHHRAKRVGIAAAIAAFVVAIAYWLVVMQKQDLVAPNNRDSVAEVVNRLDSSSVQVTPEDAKRVSSQLSGSSYKPSDKAKQDAINALYPTE